MKARSRHFSALRRRRQGDLPCNPVACRGTIVATRHARFVTILVATSAMAHFPDFAAFAELAATADYVPVYRRVLSDVLTPVSAFHKIDDGGSACLFESVIGGEKVGRYSFLAAEPFLLDASTRQAGVDHRGRRRSRKRLDVRQPARGTCASDVQAIRVAKRAGPAALYRRRGRLRRLRHGPLRRAPAERAGGRPPAARPVVRLLRPHGRVRQRAEDRDRGRAGQSRR